MHKILIDIEATCWDTRQEQDHECIQLSAILDIDGNKIGEFDAIIKPLRHPTLSAYCTELTGITQEMVDRADPFQLVWKSFVEWVQSHSLTGIETVVFYSWGLGDYAILDRECRRNNIYFPFYSFVNLKGLFKYYYKLSKTKKCGLDKALRILNMEFQGRKHNGMDDTRNEYRILKTME